jgi:hypothetical protein
MGCCLGALLLGGAPRVALALWWFLDPSRVLGPFAHWVTNIGGVGFPSWAWPAAGFLLLPWTTIAYVWLSPGGLTTIKWIVIGVGLLFDLGAHGGGGRAYQRRYAS